MDLWRVRKQLVRGIEDSPADAAQGFKIPMETRGWWRHGGSRVWSFFLELNGIIMSVICIIVSVIWECKQDWRDVGGEDIVTQRNFRICVESEEMESTMLDYTQKGSQSP